VVKHSGQSPPIAQGAEPRRGIRGRGSDSGEIGVVGEFFRPDERGHSLAPVVTQGGEFSVGVLQRQIGVVVVAAGDSFYAQQEFGECGPVPVTDEPEGVEAFPRGGGAECAGVHDARAWTLDQGDGLQRSGA